MSFLIRDIRSLFFDGGHNILLEDEYKNSIGSETNILVCALPPEEISWSLPRVPLKNRAGLIMKNWQRQLLHPLRLLGRGFRPSAGSESAYDFRKEDLIPFAVSLC